MAPNLSIDPTPITLFLQVATPKAWLDEALKNIELLLIDHALCEKKAASTALSLMYRYPDKPELLKKLAILAREELLHFEKVLEILEKKNIAYKPMAPSLYAKNMHQHINPKEPERLVDSLVIGAIIEARSCERFIALIPHLEDDIAKFYASLVKSEARHFEDYLTLAKQYANANLVDERCQFFLELENTFLLSPSPVFRFHSGLPITS